MTIYFTIDNVQHRLEKEYYPPHGQNIRTNTAIGSNFRKPIITLNTKFRFEALEILLSRLDVASQLRPWS